MDDAETLCCSCCYLQAAAHRAGSVTWSDHDGWRCQPIRTTSNSRTHTQPHACMCRVYEGRENSASTSYCYVMKTLHAKSFLIKDDRKRTKEEITHDYKDKGTERDAGSDRFFFLESKGEKRHRASCHGNLLKMAKQQLITTSTHRYDAYIMAEVTGHLLENLS